MTGSSQDTKQLKGQSQVAVKFLGASGGPAPLTTSKGSENGPACKIKKWVKKHKH